MGSTAKAVRKHQHLTKETQSWPDRARAVQIESALHYAEVADMLLGIKALREEVETVIGPVVRDAHAAHKSAVALKKVADDPLNEAERILKDRMVDYRRRQDERDEVVRKGLEAEAKKVAKAQGLEAPAVIIASSVPDVQGISTSAKWNVEVVDEAAVIKAAVRNTSLRPLLKVDKVALRRHVHAMKGQVRIPGVRVMRSETIAVRPTLLCREVRS
jgi:hypothetical protein